MQIFISGNPGSGKTTLVKRIYEEYKEYFIGFWTEEIRVNKRRVGFEVVTTWGERKILASIERRSNFRVGKYFVYPEVLDPIIEKISKERYDKKILLIDEIGRMEFYSNSFKNFILNLLKDERINILATIHRNYLHLVKSYIWLDRKKWFEIYKRIKKEIESLIKTINK